MHNYKMKPELKDFQDLLCNDKLICIKEIVDINLITKFKENEVYNAMTIYIDYSGKYDSEKRNVTLVIHSGFIRCEFVEYGLSAENRLLNKMRECFVPLNDVVRFYRKMLNK